MSLSGWFKRQSPTIIVKLLMIFLISIPSAWSYSPYTNRELDEIEKEFVQQINEANSVIRHPLATQYINHVAQQLASNVMSKQPDFFIVESNEINAFAGPGGHIGVNSQLILATENESELAAVMAHEMAHVRLHHLFRRLEHQKRMKAPMLASVLAAAALGVLNPALGSGALMASLSGFAQESINFTRANEKEADRIGIDMLIKAGFDPRGMAGFFKKMQEHTRYYYTDNIPALLRSHPLDEHRIAEAENRTQTHIKSHYEDHLDYHLFKELIRISTTNQIKALLDFYPKTCEKSNTSIACQYGQALALMKANKNTSAKAILQTLQQQKPDNLYFNLALSEAEINLHEYEKALSKLKQLSTDFPNDYAVLLTYAEGLMAAGKPQDAANVLLKGSRQYKHNLLICKKLAQSHAAAKHKDYAYFTLAQCELLQGHQKKALRQLKLAKQFAASDHLIKERINAKIDEIQFLMKN